MATPRRCAGTPARGSRASSQPGMFPAAAPHDGCGRREGEEEKTTCLQCRRGRRIVGTALTARAIRRDSSGLSRVRYRARGGARREKREKTEKGHSAHGVVTTSSAPRTPTTATITTASTPVDVDVDVIAIIVSTAPSPCIVSVGTTIATTTSAATTATFSTACFSRVTPSSSTGFIADRKYTALVP